MTELGSGENPRLWESCGNGSSFPLGLVLGEGWAGVIYYYMEPWMKANRAEGKDR